MSQNKLTPSQRQELGLNRDFACFEMTGTSSWRQAAGGTTRHRSRFLKRGHGTCEHVHLFGVAGAIECRGDRYCHVCRVTVLVDDVF